MNGAVVGGMIEEVVVQDQMIEGVVVQDQEVRLIEATDGMIIVDLHR